MQTFESGRLKRTNSARGVAQVTSLSRRALAQPRFLLVGAGLALLGAGLVAKAQNTSVSQPVPMATTTTNSSSHPIGDIVEKYSRLQQIKAVTGASTSASSLAKSSLGVSAIPGNGQSGYNLVDVNVTANTVSDERDPVFSPGGDRIAFASNRTDASGTAKGSRYHIWVMNSDGTNVRQITGLNANGSGDATRDQRFPAWSPNGETIVYVDGTYTFDGSTDVEGGFDNQAQLYQVFNVSSSPSPARLTNYTGRKRNPVYSADGTEIVFASDRDPLNLISGQTKFDIFKAFSSGGASPYNSLSYRLTGSASDTNGQAADDWAPSFSVSDPNYIYFSSNRTTSSVLASGRRIWRMQSNGSGAAQISDPSQRGGSASDVDDHPIESGTSVNRVAFQSNSLLGGGDTTPDYNVWVIPGNGTVEASGQADVATNILSSPTNFTDSKLPSSSNLSEDKVDDVEPSYTRNYTANIEAASLTFASKRTRLQTSAGTVVNPSGSYDIWTTKTRDFTPPVLVPISEDNNDYIIAPRDNSPFNAPRTPAGGLFPGGTTKLAFVLSDFESGIQSGDVVARIYDANQPQFTTRSSKINEDISVSVQDEIKAAQVGSDISINVWDDGASEKQANPVAGDGYYYCEALLPAPNNTSDYYIDIVVKDREGNDFTYDNIWGFSTKAFTKSGLKTDLFVSDYTASQQFVGTVNTTNSLSDLRAYNQFPVESYWLTNPGGQIGGASALVNHPDNDDLVSTPYSFNPATVDIWRTQCRGAIPPSVYDAYTPRTTLQIDPSDTGGENPLSSKTRKVAVADSVILWAAPYAGLVVAGQGTINDTATQSELTRFLSNGGRLFISGRDIAWSLSAGGTTSNQFLQNELAADFSRETISHVITAGPGEFLYQPVREYILTGYDDLQIPNNFTSLTDKYSDAALNHSPNVVPITFAPIGAWMDAISPRTIADTKTVTAYTVGGAVVGQRVEKNKRNNGFQSRAVFYGFGFEAINRRYRKSTPPTWTRQTLDARYVMANNLRYYLKTGSISGTVTNNSTNQPIPDFLVQVTGSEGTYYVRTGSDGRYQVDGIPVGGYLVQPYYDTSVEPNSGFFGGAPNDDVGVVGGAVTSNVDFRPSPKLPGSVRGRVAADQGTPDDRADDAPISNLPVLLRSVDTSNRFLNGGKFAALTYTDSQGDFSFGNVPAGAQLEVVLNPTPGKESDGGDFPDNVQITYDQSNVKNEYSRRVIPDSKRPGDIVLDSGSTFVVNDLASVTDTDDASDNGLRLLLPEPTVTGSVTLKEGNSAAAAYAGATVTLLDSGNGALATTTTNGSGQYSFVGSVLGSATQVKASVTLDGYPLEKTVPISSSTANVALTIANVGGTVSINNVGTADFLVELLQNGNPVTFGSFTRTATTNASGQYTIRYVPAGDNYSVRFTKSVSGETLTHTTTIFSVPDNGVVVRNYNFTKLFDSASGTVTLSGTAISGATVKLYKNGDATEVATTTTNSSGRYTFNTLAAGNYRVEVNFTSGGNNFDSRNSSFSNTFTVQATPTGENHVVNFNFDFSQLNGVRGKVTVAGVPFQGATVELLNNKKRSIPTGSSTTTTTNSGGEYIFANVSPDGRYYVRAVIYIQGRKYTSAMVAADVSGGNATANINFKLTVLTGKVTANNANAVGVVVELLDTKGRSLKPQRVAQTNSQGDYYFFAPKTGSLIVRATSNGTTGQVTTKIKSNVLNTAPTINLTIQQAKGQVLLRQLDSSTTPLAGATIVVNNLNGIRVFGPIQTDSNGNFDVRGLAVGDYKFRVTKTLDSVVLDQTFTVRQGLGLVTPTLIVDYPSGGSGTTRSGSTSSARKF